MDSVFEWLSAEPLASASLGQVRRAPASHFSLTFAIKAQDSLAACCCSSLCVRILGFWPGWFRCPCTSFIALGKCGVLSITVKWHARPHCCMRFVCTENASLYPSPQVYKGKLRGAWGGAEVAVKIQRPGVLESVALDLFIMRRASIVFSQLPGAWPGACRICCSVQNILRCTHSVQPAADCVACGLPCSKQRFRDVQAWFQPAAWHVGCGMAGAPQVSYVAHCPRHRHA